MGPASAPLLGTGLAPRLGARRRWFPKTRGVFDHNREDRATVDVGAGMDGAPYRTPCQAGREIHFKVLRRP